VREELDAVTDVNCDRRAVLAPASNLSGDRLFGLGGKVAAGEVAFRSHSLAPFILSIGGHGPFLFARYFQCTQMHVPNDRKRPLLTFMLRWMGHARGTTAPRTLFGEPKRAAQRPTSDG
jgi:hypothetical protein